MTLYNASYILQSLMTLWKVVFREKNYEPRIYQQFLSVFTLYEITRDLWIGVIQSSEVIYVLREIFDLESYIFLTCGDNIFI